MVVLEQNKKMNKFIFFWLIFPLIAFTCDLNSQEIAKGEYKIKIKDYKKGDPIYIGYYFGKKQYIKDTLIANHKGEVVFKGTDLPCGLYLLIFGHDKKKSFIDFIIDEPSFSLTTSFKKKEEDLVIEGSVQNEDFLAYKKYLAKQRLEVEKIDQSSKPEEEKKSYKEKINKKVEDYQHKLLNKYKNKFLGHFLKSDMAIKTDPLPANLSEEEEKNYKFYNFRKKYIESIDFSMSYLLYSPIYYKKLMNLFENLVVKTPDSVIVKCDEILNLAYKNKRMFQFTLSTLYNYYSKSKIICFDRVSFHLVNNYYLTNKVGWMEDYQIKRMRDYKDRAQNTLCGSMFKNLTLPDIEDNQQSVYNIDGDYKLILFWTTSTSLAKNAITYLDKLDFEGDFTVKKIGINVNKKVYPHAYSRAKFVKEKILETAVLIGAKEKYDLYEELNISKIPSLFILNAKNEIIGKGITVYKVKEFLENYHQHNSK